MDETKQLAVENYEGDIIWVSADTKIASVSTEGVVTGISEGEAMILAMLSDGTTLKATVIIMLSQAQSGDLNGDNSVNLKDVVLLRRFIAGGWNVVLDEKIADLNGDGKVNLKDVVLLRRFIAGGWNVAL